MLSASESSVQVLRDRGGGEVSRVLENSLERLDRLADVDSGEEHSMVGLGRRKR